MGIPRKDLAEEKDLLAAIDALSPLHEFIYYPDFGEKEEHPERIIWVEGSMLFFSLHKPDVCFPFKPETFLSDSAARAIWINERLQKNAGVLVHNCRDAAALPLREQYELHNLVLIEGVLKRGIPALVKGTPPLHVMMLDDFLCVIQETMSFADFTDYLIYRDNWLGISSDQDWYEKDLLASFLLNGRPLSMGNVLPSPGLWDRKVGSIEERALHKNWDEPKAYFCEDIIHYSREQNYKEDADIYSCLAYELNSLSYARRLEFGAKIIKTACSQQQKGTPCHFEYFGANGRSVLVYLADAPGYGRQEYLQKLCDLTRCYYQVPLVIGVAACRQELLQVYQAAESRGGWGYDPETEVEAIAKIAAV